MNFYFNYSYWIVWLFIIDKWSWRIHFPWQSELLLYFVKSHSELIIVSTFLLDFLFIGPRYRPCNCVNFCSFNSRRFNCPCDNFSFSHRLRHLILNDLRWSNLPVGYLYLSFLINNSSFDYHRLLLNNLMRRRRLMEDLSNNLSFRRLIGKLLTLHRNRKRRWEFCSFFSYQYLFWAIWDNLRFNIDRRLLNNSLDRRFTKWLPWYRLMEDRILQERRNLSDFKRFNFDDIIFVL